MMSYHSMSSSGARLRATGGSTSDGAQAVPFLRQSPWIARLNRAMTVSLVLALSPHTPALATDIPMDTVVFGNLDKVTGRVNTMSGQVDAPARFGTLEIVPRACFARPPEEPPENAAFVEIFDIPENGQKTKVFSGWMFASSPALSALDHPVYDLWVLRCESSKASKSD
jgi:hypothetical protein